MVSKKKNIIHGPSEFFLLKKYNKRLKRNVFLFCFCFLFCFVLFCFVLFCFVLFFFN